MIIEFRDALLVWYDSHQRDHLPWNQTKDPYKIWLSEIMLQQTQVKQGLPYYLKFVEAFPSVKDLARASTERVMQMWQGLGYYSRARNMHATAQYISEKLNGIFPNTYDDILQLKGVGKYTAAAIASFAYDLPYPAVDGNMIRVLSRVFDMDDRNSYNAFLKEINTLADRVIPKHKPAAFNRAIMDLGSLICTSRSPDCAACPVSKLCLALHHQRVGELPPKKPKIKVTERYLLYLVIQDEDHIMIRSRSEKDIWQGLHEFYLVEMEQLPSIGHSAIEQLIDEKLEIADYSIGHIHTDRQRLTHRLVYAVFVSIHLKGTCRSQHLPKGYKYVSKKRVKEYGYPRIIVKYIDQYLSPNA